MSSRKIVQDMVPSSRKVKPAVKIVAHVPIRRDDVVKKTTKPAAAHTVRAEKIPIHIHKQTNEGAVAMHIREGATPVILEGSSSRKRTMRRRPLFLITTGAVCLASIVIALFFVSAKATVIIIPKQITVAADTTLTACKDSPCSTTSSSSGLAYEVIQIPAIELHQTLPATNGPSVGTNAQGMIVLYNKYNSSSQTIPQGTLLSNVGGFIYRTTKTVVIPGMKNGAAGSVGVSIIAVASGSQYNILPTDLTGDFKVVAYKGTPKYNALYGRLDPNNSIAGGFSGYKKIVASTTLASTYATLQQKLSDQLISSSKALIPAGYIMYDNGYSIAYTQLPLEATSSGLVDVGLQATFSGIMFKQNDLVDAIAAKTVPDLSMAMIFPNDSYTTSGLEALTYKMLTTSSNVSTSTSPIMFKLGGSFGLTGTFSVTDIAQSLVGKNMAQSNDIFAKYGAIASAHATISPFWRHTFPDTPNNISITIQ